MRWGRRRAASRPSDTARPTPRAESPRPGLVVEEYGRLLLLRQPSDELLGPADIADLTRALEADGDDTVTVVASADGNTAAALWARLGALIDTLCGDGVGTIRLAMTRAGDDRPGSPSVARRIADAWEIDVIAPDGTVLGVPGGGLFVHDVPADGEPDGGPEGGWWRFSPGAPPVPLGPRQPAPGWQPAPGSLPSRTRDGCVVEQIPAGVLVRPAGARAPRPGDLCYAVPVDRHGMLVVVGVPDGEDVTSGDVADLVTALPAAARTVLRFAPGGRRDVLRVGQDAAELVDADVVVYSGLPLLAESFGRDAGTVRAMTVGADGAPRWQPFVDSVICAPGASSPRLLRWSPPLPGRGDARRGVVRLSDRWQVTATRAGLWINGTDKEPPPFAARPVDPQGPEIEVGGPGEALDRSLWPVLEKLLGTLPPGLSARTRVHVHGTAVDGGRELRRLAAEHQVRSLRFASFGRTAPAAHGPGRAAHGPAAGPAPAPGTPRPGPANAATGTAGTAAVGAVGPGPRTTVGSAPDAASTAGAAAPGPRPAADGHASGGKSAATDPGVPAPTSTNVSAPLGARAEQTPAAPGPAPAPDRRPDTDTDARPDLGTGADMSTGANADTRPDFDTGADTGTGTDRVTTPEAAPPSPPRSLPTTTGTPSPDGGAPAAGVPSTATAPGAPGTSHAAAPFVPRVPETATGAAAAGASAGHRAPSGRSAAVTGAEPSQPSARRSPSPSAAPERAPQPERAPHPDRAPQPEPASAPEDPDVRTATGHDEEAPLPAPPSRPVLTSTPSPAAASPADPSPAAAERAPRPAEPSTPPGRPAEKDPTPPAAGTMPEPPQAPPKPLPPVPFLPGHQSTHAERAAFRSLADGVWDRQAAVVTRLFTRMPALRGHEQEAARADLIALLLHLRTGVPDDGLGHEELGRGLRAGDPRLLPYGACVGSALRRLPSFRGVVLRGAGPDGGTPGRTPVPGTVLRDAAPVSALPGDGRGPSPADARYAIWSVTGRRVRQLSDVTGTAARYDEVVFAPGTAFRVLDIRAGGSSPLVLLRELPATQRASPVGPAQLDDQDRTVLARLGEALDRPDAAAVPFEWPARCAGPVGCSDHGDA
ncbi:hypothetical protein [Streptomyces fragilis]|uniref:ADP ribosyltransferase domain-containing protein n=1 Tax=Streptomyces fragilis TaxID=67301 RepID=A0ABV2YMU5_9ACTN|nr:hypothetical protein [Streptomyces fragilis]